MSRQEVAGRSPGSPPAPKGGTARGHRREVAGFLLASPALFGLAAFIVLPFLLAVALSFTNLRLGSPLPTEFVGFEEYRRVLQDETFRRALFNNCVFAAVVVPLQTALALILALLLNRKLAGRALFRTLFFMPVVFPMALVAVVWELLYAPGPEGTLNAVLELITLGNWKPVEFLRHEVLALPSIMMLSIWQGVGLQMVVLLAGLQSIPGVLYEAASIDRAGRLPQFLHVTLPQLRNPLIFTALVTSILAFRLFDQVQILTQGGPDDGTTTMIFEAVRAVFDRQQVGQAAVMTVLFFVIVLALTCLQRSLVKQEREVS